MDVELVTDITSEDENFGFDDNSEDYLNYEGERCGICMDTVIDRGVLDCCQHWFCFACIDNWATITSLCPLCQNEFQLITCVPVHDTVGGTQTDDETNPRDDEWFIEGKTNTLSFPSYYIAENAVSCLDGGGCKIRSGSVEIGEDSDIDTSIACDSCDKWYHAFCVEFDTEGTCEGSWLCPGCTVVKDPQRSDGASVSRKHYQNGVEIPGGNNLAEPSFSGRVSVSVADDGETAVVISLFDKSQQSGESVAELIKDMDNNVSSSTSNMLNSEALPDYRNNIVPDSCQQETEIYLSRHNCQTALHLLSPAEMKICADDALDRTPTHSNNMSESDLVMKNNDLSEDHVARSLEANKTSEDLLPAVNMESNGTEALSMKSMMPDVKQTTSGTTGAKRKHGDHRNSGHGEIEAKLSRKKIKSQIVDQPNSLTDQIAVSFMEDSNTTSAHRSLENSTYTCLSGEENGTPDIMDIVQETDRRTRKQLGLKNASDLNPKERETAAGLRLKKIMRRTDDNKDSSALVQELRKKIREAVRNKSSEEVGQNLFDPKLLDAFRAALAGSGAQNRKPIIDMKAKRSLLQKGKVRESLTKKIYGTGGKRKRAWTRECEVEFWKHRCLKASKPEKIQALKSVLDVLRDDSNHTKKKSGDDQEAKGSILSRLYLADTSVFPRQNDIKPVSALNTVSTPEQKRDSGSTERTSKLRPNNHSDINLQKYNTISEAIIPPPEIKEMKNRPKGVKPEGASSDAQLKRHPKGAPTLGKGLGSKPDSMKGDRRKWALELLARKTAASGKNMQEIEEDSLILKGNYPLLAQLPKDMRPVLAPCRHNKISTSIRQAQLYRLTEHFLKKANLSVVSQTAETELAVADAVNIEKDVANRSNSKLVYVNLCSQELSRRSVDINSNRAEEENPCSISGSPSVGASEETNNSSLDLAVDEALKNAGLMSDSPPNSPSHPTEDVDNQLGSPENMDEGPDNVIEVDSHPDLDIYGDFEYSLEDDDFIGASILNTSKQECEPPKIKMLFSSVKSEEPNRILELADHEVQRDDPLACSSDLLESQNKPSTGGSTVDSTVDECVVPKSSNDNDDELSLAECEELYGPDVEPLIEKYPETASALRLGHSVNDEDNRSTHGDKSTGKPSEHQANDSRLTTEQSNRPSSDSEKRENANTKEKTSKGDAKQSENRSMVMKKVESYIKEHIRPLCKSGVITVEQYSWAVGKTTEKVMKYHSKERNANFLIKEGDKVKRLAEQYVEASQQKTKA